MNVIKVPDDKALLVVFTDLVNMINPHVMVAFNGHGYDFPVLWHMIYHKLNDKSSPVRAFCKHMNFVDEWSESPRLWDIIRKPVKKFLEKPNALRGCQLPHVFLLDSQTINGKLDSVSINCKLDTLIAEHTHIPGKYTDAVSGKEVSSFWISGGDPMKIGVYCLIDVYGDLLVSQKLQLIEFTSSIAEVVQCSIAVGDSTRVSRMGSPGSGLYPAHLILARECMHSENFFYIYNKFSETPVQGGWVCLNEGIVGVQEYVCNLDFASQYPYQMMFRGCSPEHVFDTPEELLDLLPLLKENANHLSVTPEMIIGISLNELEGPHKHGVMNLLKSTKGSLVGDFQKRSLKNRKALRARGEENLQLAVKCQMNSFYGVLPQLGFGLVARHITGNSRLDNRNVQVGLLANDFTLVYQDTDIVLAKPNFKEGEKPTSDEYANLHKRVTQEGGNYDYC